MRDEYGSGAALRSPPHVTLQAPFKWSLSDVPKLSEVLRQFAASQSQIAMMLDGFNAFEPRVLYVDVARRDGLMALHTQLRNAMERDLGIVSKQDRNRDFIPHLTIAFHDLNPEMFYKAWSVFQSLEIHFDFVAHRLTLLIHDGESWIVKEHYPFVAAQHVE